MVHNPTMSHRLVLFGVSLTLCLAAVANPPMKLTVQKKAEITQAAQNLNNKRKALVKRIRDSNQFNINGSRVTLKQSVCDKKEDRPNEKLQCEKKLEEEARDHSAEISEIDLQLTRMKQALELLELNEKSVGTR
jgi:hypothetical protein